VILTWNNGSVGPTALYSWTLAGAYTITVTATNDCGQVQDTFVVNVLCAPVEEVVIEGPAMLLVGESGHYTAVYAPPTSTLPVTLTWNNGGGDATAVYSWSDPGAYTVTVTVTNPCGAASTTQSVQVCQPVTGVTVMGPLVLQVGQEGIYQATAQPITASIPLTFTWGNGTVGTSAVYSWPATGTYTVTVTGTNACGQGWGNLKVQVREDQPYQVYLPIAFKK
jgi:hypothetical protein